MADLIKQLNVDGSEYPFARYTAVGTCSTAAATAEKVVTLTAGTTWSLEPGSVIAVKFTYTNSASNPKLNIAGTGAKPVYYNTTVITTSNLNYAGYKDRYLEYMYDGTNYVCIGSSFDNNSTYTNASLGQGYAVCSTAANVAEKTATLSNYKLITGGIVSVKFTYGNTAVNPTLNINSTGAIPIYYRGKVLSDSGLICASEIATLLYDSSNGRYHLINLDRTRFNPTLIPLGQLIAGESDLNSPEFMRVGNYYCTPTATVKTLVNCPVEEAFMMTVSSPLSTSIDNETTSQYVYRLRKLQVYTGDEYIQFSSVSATPNVWTYGSWIKTSRNNHKHKVTASGTISSTIITPEGTVTAPTITVTPSTASIYSITGVGSVPSLTYTTVSAAKIDAWSSGTLPELTFSGGSGTLTGSVSNRRLTLSHTHTAATATFEPGTIPHLNYKHNDVSSISAWSAGSVPTRSSKTVVIGIDSATATAPTFTGTPQEHEHTFSGSQVQSTAVI